MVLFYLKITDFNLLFYKVFQIFIVATDYHDYNYFIEYNGLFGRFC